MVAGQWFSARRRLRKSVWRPGWAPVGAFEAPPCAQSGLQGRFFALALASLAFAWPAACLPRGRLLGARFWAQGFQTCVMAGCRQPGGGQRQGLQNMLAPWRLSGRGRFVCSTFVFFCYAHDSTVARRAPGAVRRFAAAGRRFPCSEPFGKTAYDCDGSPKRFPAVRPGQR